MGSYDHSKIILVLFLYQHLLSKINVKANVIVKAYLREKNYFQLHCSPECIMNGFSHLKKKLCFVLQIFRFFMNPQTSKNLMSSIFADVHHFFRRHLIRKNLKLNLIKI